MAAEVVEVVEMGWWRGWLGDGNLLELELVKGDGPPAYLGASAAGGPSPAASAPMVGGRPRASVGDKEESSEDLIDLPDLILKMMTNWDLRGCLSIGGRLWWGVER